MTDEPDGSAPEPDVSTIGGLVQELEHQANLLVAVATGGPLIQTVQAEYQDLYWLYKTSVQKEPICQQRLRLSSTVFANRCPE